MIVRVQGEDYTSYVEDVLFFVEHLRALGDFSSIHSQAGECEGPDRKLQYETSFRGIVRGLGGIGCKRGGSKVLT